ncbi:MAG TPA: hypothetical protein VMF91_16570 [Bryobacteraceae bacterium]|nr:hypothetical protein [Bryobacteraceae bacterium]
MRINPKSFATIGRQTPYLAWAEKGLTPGAIKARVIATLQPHFENSSVLSDLSIEVLSFEAVLIDRLSSDPWAAAMFAGVLSEYRGALNQDQRKCLDALTAWDEQIAHAMSEFYSMYLVEADKAGLELDEFRVELLRNIGGLLEACVQPNLKALLHQVRIRRAKSAHKAHLENLKFGEVVEELSRTLCVPDLLAPPPWALKVHVLRNIAQHHSAFSRGGRIVANYRTGQRKVQIEFTKEELLEVARKLNQVQGILRAARTIFYLDNAGEIQNPWGSDLRPDVSILFLTAAIASQGFEAVDLNISDTLAHLQVRDVTGGDARDRGIHASQFLIQVWVACRTPKVQVTYIDKDGRVRLLAEAKNSDCEDVANGRTPFEVLASRVVFRVPSVC